MRIASEFIPIRLVMALHFVFAYFSFDNVSLREILNFENDNLLINKDGIFGQEKKMNFHSDSLIFWTKKSEKRLGRKKSQIFREDQRKIEMEIEITVS